MKRFIQNKVSYFMICYISFLMITYVGVQLDFIGKYFAVILMSVILGWGLDRVTLCDKCFSDYQENFAIFKNEFVCGIVNNLDMKVENSTKSMAICLKGLFFVLMGVMFINY
ncbi:MAG: hypothetical protein V3575_02200 [Candidatus Absconditabacteria bacterium]